MGQIIGTNTNDSLVGTNGDDTIFGGDGNDIIFGNEGRNFLYGEAGDDTICGAEGQNILLGGDGKDTFKFTFGNNKGNSIFDFVSGIDVIDFSDLNFTKVRNFSDLKFMYNASTTCIFLGDYSDYIQVIGSHSFNYKDFIFNTISPYSHEGDERSNYLFGSNYADNMAGKDGNDTIWGYDGDDIIDGGAGGDSLIGGAGNDVFKFKLDEAILDIIDDFDIAVDKIDLSDISFTSTDDVNFNSINNIKDIIFGHYYTYSTIELGSSVGHAGGAIIIFKNNIDTSKLTEDNFILTKPLNITGTASTDNLVGTGLADSLKGLSGNDTLLGNAGNDTLIGGADADVLTGNAGQDIFKYESLADSFKTSGKTDLITDFVRGEDKIDFSALGLQAFSYGKTVQGSLEITYDAVNNKTIIADKNSSFAIALSGNHSNLNNSDFIFGNPLLGNASNNNMNGTVGADVMSGQKGNDTVAGADGNDTLYGNQGNDILLGGIGNDTLDGGAGIDRLTGSAGADIFKFSNVSDSVRTGLTSSVKMDVITDFVRGEDKIDVSGLGFHTISSTNSADLKIIYDAVNHQALVIDTHGTTFGFLVQGEYLDQLNASDFIF